jgi:hypothetical protein
MFLRAGSPFRTRKEVLIKNFDITYANMRSKKISMIEGRRTFRERISERIPGELGARTRRILFAFFVSLITRISFRNNFYRFSPEFMTENQPVVFYHPTETSRVVLSTVPPVTLASVRETLPGTKAVRRKFPLPVTIFIEPSAQLSAGRYQLVGQYDDGQRGTLDMWASIAIEAPDTAAATAPAPAPDVPIPASAAPPPSSSVPLALKRATAPSALEKPTAPLSAPPSVASLENSSVMTDISAIAEDSCIISPAGAGGVRLLDLELPSSEDAILAFLSRTCKARGCAGTKRRKAWGPDDKCGFCGNKPKNRKTGCGPECPGRLHYGDSAPPSEYLGKCRQAAVSVILDHHGLTNELEVKATIKDSGVREKIENAWGLNNYKTNIWHALELSLRQYTDLKSPAAPTAPPSRKRSAEKEGNDDDGEKEGAAVSGKNSAKERSSAPPPPLPHSEPPLSIEQIALNRALAELDIKSAADIGDYLLDVECLRIGCKRDAHIEMTPEKVCFLHRQLTRITLDAIPAAVKELADKAADGDLYALVLLAARHPVPASMLRVAHLLTPSELLRANSSDSPYGTYGLPVGLAEKEALSLPRHGKLTHREIYSLEDMRAPIPSSVVRFALHFAAEKLVRLRYCARASQVWIASRELCNWVFGATDRPLSATLKAELKDHGCCLFLGMLSGHHPVLLELNRASKRLWWYDPLEAIELHEGVTAESSRTEVETRLMELLTKQLFRSSLSGIGWDRSEIPIDHYYNHERYSALAYDYLLVAGLRVIHARMMESDEGKEADATRPRPSELSTMGGPEFVSLRRNLLHELHRIATDADWADIAAVRTSIQKSTSGGTTTPSLKRNTSNLSSTQANVAFAESSIVDITGEDSPEQRTPAKRTKRETAKEKKKKQQQQQQQQNGGKDDADDSTSIHKLSEYIRLEQEKPKKGARFVFKRNTEITIGRDAQCHYPVQGLSDHSISRLQATIVWRNGGYLLRHEGRHATKVDDVKLDKPGQLTPLSNGSLISVGDEVCIRVELRNRLLSDRDTDDDIGAAKDSDDSWFEPANPDTAVYVVNKSRYAQLFCQDKEGKDDAGNAEADDDKNNTADRPDMSP